MKEEKISIIIPVYNAAKYLQQCIESILTQTYANYEIILIDDGSTDGSGKICDHFERGNVKVIHQKNRGVSVARNEGIRAARGEYIMFVDADDTIEPEMLKSMIGVVSKYDKPDLVICDYSTRKNNEIVWHDDFFEFVTFNEMWAPWAKLIKKDRIKHLFNDGIYVAEDLSFFYQNRGRFRKFVYLPAKLYNYSFNRQSAINKKIVKETDLSCLDVFLEIIRNQELPESVILFYMAYYIKMYHFLFSKKVSKEVGKAEKRWYGRWIDRFYGRLKDAKMIDAKIFTQVKLTPFYNIHSRLK